MLHPLTFLAFALCGISFAGPVYTAPFGPDGTWNLYQRVEKSVTWDEAKKEAEAMPAPLGDAKTMGHLITFSSRAENQFARLVNPNEAWCALTDDERFGGKEAGNHPLNGWKWTNGEPLIYTNWKSLQPDDWREEGSGEDAVLFDYHGKWSDVGSGVAGQKPITHYYVVEWETHSPTPVEGAIPLEKAWPAKSMMPASVPGKWIARWRCAYIRVSESRVSLAGNIQVANPLFQPATHEKDSKIFIQSEGTGIGNLPWLMLSTRTGCRQAWLPDQPGELNFPELASLQDTIGTIAGKIHVAKAGTYTFLITAEDTFALRIGGLKWKSAGGDGFIDPLDPLTVTQPNASFDTKALAVMDLPEGDHVVEAIWTSLSQRSELTILSAPGVHSTEGSTADWRPLGYQKSQKKIPLLGVSAAGWTVECSAGQKKELSLQDGLIKLELDLARLTKSGVVSLNFADAPPTNPAHFPDASVILNDKPDTMNDHWPLRASAKLIVPQDGNYQIGMHAGGYAALRIKGGNLKRATQTAQDTKDLHLQPDTFDFSGQTYTNNEPKIFTEWELKKGEYDIDVFYVKNIGPASLAVFSCPQGPYPPALLTAGGAKLADDVAGLPLATPTDSKK